MRRVFSEESKRASWRKAWLALAEGEHVLGLVSKEELDGIRSAFRAGKIDIPAALAVEGRIHHDLMAELRVFADQANSGGGKLHLGATSADIEDNADTARYSVAMEIVTRRLVDCLSAARKKIMRHRGTVCMGWTHLQPAEPTTLGYRFANYAQDLLMDLDLLQTVQQRFLLAKGVKGAVGTSASFRALLGSTAKSRELDKMVMKKLSLTSFEVATQTYPRKVDFLILACLASVAQSCHKFGMDVRVMQSPGFGEWSEPFGEGQVGSSAMPFKRNPVMAERMCSLARVVPAFLNVGFSNAAGTILERTLDDSASRRIVLPEAFLAVDECLRIYEKVMSGLQVHPQMVKRNLEKYGSFAGTEPLMMKLVERGANRQKMHELIRIKSTQAWQEVMADRPNPLERILAADSQIKSKVQPEELHELMDPTSYIGDADERCELLVRREIDPLLANLRRRGRNRKS